MKLMKRFALLLLCLALVFAMVACGEDEDPEAEGEAEGEVQSNEAAEYLKTIWDEAMEANSWTITADLFGSASKDSVEVEVNGEFSSTFAKTDDGFDASFEFSGEIDNSYDTKSFEAEAALVDNVAYLKAYEDGKLVEEEEIDLEDVGANEYIDQYLATFESLLDLDALGIPAEVVTQFVDTIAEIFSTVTEKVDGDYVVEKNYVEDVEAVIDLINSFDDLTVRELADQILAGIDESLSVEAIFNAIKEIKDKTVEEFYEELDAEFKAATGLTIQELYEEIVNNEMFVTYMTDMLRAPAYVIDQVQDMKIEEILDPYMDYSLDDFVKMYIGGGMGVNSLIGMAEDFLDQNVEDLIKQSVGNSNYNEFLDIVDSIDANDLTFKLTFKANSDNEYEGYSAYANVDVAFRADGDAYAFKGTLNFDLTLSSETVNIEIPD